MAERRQLDEWVEAWYDARIRELQAHVDHVEPFEPEPGAPDYLTSAQRQQLRASVEEDT